MCLVLKPALPMTWRGLCLMNNMALSTPREILVSLPAGKSFHTSDLSDPFPLIQTWVKGGETKLFVGQNPKTWQLGLSSATMLARAPGLSYQ